MRKREDELMVSTLVILEDDYNHVTHVLGGVTTNQVWAAVKKVQQSVKKNGLNAVATAVDLGILPMPEDRLAYIHEGEGSSNSVVQHFVVRVLQGQGAVVWESKKVSYGYYEHSGM